MSEGAAALPHLDLRADRLRTVFDQTVVELVVNLICISVVAGMFWPDAPRAQMLAWIGAGTLLWVLRLAHYLRFVRTVDPDADTLLRWSTGWAAVVLLQGVLWGLAAWLFYGLGDTFHLIGLILIVYTYCLGTVQLLARQPRVLLAFMSLALLPIIVRVATDVSQPWHLQFAGLLAVLFGVALLMARGYRGALETAVVLKVRTERLAAQLRIEKAAADEARRAAEAANAAKTQFLAAASHDLRQPLHAMGLFAEALRQRCNDAEVMALVNSINQSVDALENLFGALLDITRIDSGGVDVNPQAVPVRELFGRIALHFGPTAVEKGLVLTFCGARHVLHTDPVLIERVLSNLVSNAIRYTEEGGVLVSCRSRGDRLLLQVWDTGIGIPHDVLPRVFDEFYQVHDRRSTDDTRQKGLGLGLSIVKRLSGLLDVPLSIRSVPGCGSVFGVSVPRGRAMPEPPAGPAGMPGQIELALAGRTIVVVEDERAVREGLEVLLEAWGATVLSFDSLPAVERWAAGPDAVRPALLICDWRLGDGDSGIDAISIVRRAKGAAIPALVVTGTAMSDHEEQAAAHDFHLLLKPVMPTKLRAMIAFKLGPKKTSARRVRRRRPTRVPGGGQ